MASQSTSSVTASKVLVGSSGAVEAAAVADVEYAAADGEKDGTPVLSVEREERSRCVGAEDFGWWSSGNRRCRVGS